MRSVSSHPDVRDNHVLYIPGMYVWIALWRNMLGYFVFHSRNYWSVFRGMFRQGILYVILQGFGVLYVLWIIFPIPKRGVDVSETVYRDAVERSRVQIGDLCRFPGPGGLGLLELQASGNR